MRLSAEMSANLTPLHGAMREVATTEPRHFCYRVSAMRSAETQKNGLHFQGFRIQRMSAYNACLDRLEDKK